MGGVPSSPTSKSSSGSSRRRIRKELHKLWVDPPSFCRPGASPVTDLLHWEVVIDGPEDSPYAGGTFPVDVQFIGHHPFRAPKITFKTKVYHPNINPEGQMVLDISEDNWSPALTVDKLLLSIVSVLYGPLLDHPINGRAAHLYKTDVKMYEEVARAWTRRYASSPIVSYYPREWDDNWQDYCDAIAAHNAELEKEQRRRKAEKRRRKAAAAASPRRQSSGVSILWRRTVAFLQGRGSVALPSTVKPVAN